MSEITTERLDTMEARANDATDGPLEHPALVTEVRELRAQLRAAQDDAWKRGYDACRAGEQRHSPYRTVKADAVAAPELSPLQMSANDARNWAYANMPLYTYEELVNVPDDELRTMIEAHVDQR